MTDGLVSDEAVAWAEQQADSIAQAARIAELEGALGLWLAYDDQDEADFANAGPMLLYARAIEATRQALGVG